MGIMFFHFERGHYSWIPYFEVGFVIKESFKYQNDLLWKYDIKLKKIAIMMANYNKDILITRMTILLDYSKI
jgi:hypothetical protein